MNADGSEPTRLTDDPALYFHAKWSPAPPSLLFMLAKLDALIARTGLSELLPEQR